MLREPSYRAANSCWEYHRKADEEVTVPSNPVTPVNGLSLELKGFSHYTRFLICCRSVLPEVVSRVVLLVICL